jgi:PAS domain S-box-containing protein
VLVIRKTMWRIVLLAIGYALLGVLAQGLLAIPGYGAPFWPAAGLGLAAMLLWGKRCWPGIWLGSFVGSVGLEAYLTGHPSFLLPAMIASGAALQGVVGARLTRRYLELPAPLSRSQEVASFLVLGGPVACLLSASVAIGALVATGRLSPDIMATRWLTWWTGDSIGVLLCVPLVFLFLPGARVLSRTRALPVTVPLLITGGLLLIANGWLIRNEETTANQQARRHMRQVMEGAARLLPANLEALNSLERFYAASNEVDRQEFAQFTARIVAHPGMHAVQWLPRISATARATLEAELSLEGFGEVHLTERASTGMLTIAGEREEYFPVQFIEPLTENQVLIAFDHASLPLRRTAMMQACDQNQAIAAEVSTLVQSGRQGVLVFVPYYGHNFNAEKATVAQRRQALKGFFLGSLDLATLFAGFTQSAQQLHLDYEVTDITELDKPQALLGQAPMASMAEAMTYSSELTFAGRQWSLRLYPKIAAWSPDRSWPLRLFQAFSLIAAFLVALTTLAGTGRQAAITTEVTKRTAELSRELNARAEAEAALRLSEGRLAITLDSIGDAVLATDREGRITRLNPVAERLTGWTMGEALGRPVGEVFEIINETTREPAEIPVAKVLSTGQVQGLANHTVIIARGGAEYCIADSAAPIRDAQEQIQGVVLVFRDVTLERQAAKALAASEERHRRYIEMTPLGVFVLIDGRFVFLNPSALRLFGAKSASELLGRPVLDRLHPDHRSPGEERLRRLDFEHQPVRAREFVFLRVDGSLFQGEAMAVPYQYDGKNAVLSMVQDITARKLAESQRDRFFALSPDIYCILDQQERFVRLNAASERILGWNDVELQGKRLLDQIHPDDQAKMQEALASEVGLDGANRFRVRGRHRDGTWRWLSWQSAKDPEDHHLYAAAREVGDLVLAEQALRKFNATLEAQVLERTTALQESQRFNQATLDALGVQIAVLDAQGVILTTNHAWRQYHAATGPANHDLDSGDNYLAACDTVAAGGEPEVGKLAALIRAVLAGEHSSGKQELLCPFGRPHRWFQCSVTQFPADSEVRIVVGLEDITSIKVAQQELERTQKRFIDLFEFAPDAMVMSDAEGRITQVNRQTETLFGFSREELIGRPVVALMPDADQPKPEQIRERLAKASTQRILATGRSGLKARRKDGSTFPVDLTQSPLSAAEGHQVATAIRDISKRVATEQQMRLALATLDATEDAAMIFEPETLQFFYVNDGAVRQLGYRQAELLTLKPTDIMPEYNEQRLRESMAALISGGHKSRRLTTIHRHKDGHDIPVEIHLQYIAPADERPRFITLARDISERVRMERNANRSQRMESIGTLAGGVAHDLNNALAPIMMGVELLRMRYPREEKLVSMISSSAQRGADMVRQLLTFAKGAEGKRVSVQLSHLVREMDTIMTSTFPKNIRVATHWTKDLPTVLGDATQLHQVLLNLCVNARDAMPNGGSLTLELNAKTMDATFASGIADATPGDYLTVSVQDTGSGIPPDIIERIFDPFFTTKGPDKGTGLGLSTVMGIVKGHGGFLQVYSQVGKGSQFTIYLPAETQGHRQLDQEQAQSAWQGQGELVLVVDDEPGVREVAQAVLENLKLSVITATDGADGLIKVAEYREQLDVIITDLHMPHMDGMAFARAARRMAPGVPVIIASGRFEENLTEPFREIGITLRLNKPFTQEMLAGILKAALASVNDNTPSLS